MKVADLMTVDVLSVRPETSLKDVARILSTCGISGLPVVDGEERVVGVISEADILAKERRPRRESLLRRLRGERGDGAKSSARTAGEAMSAPAITIGPRRWVDAAAALMLDRGIKRLPVVDDDGRLVGIVTRADLVTAFVSSDERIAHEIREVILRRELWLDPEAFELTVREGEVELAGATDSSHLQELLEQRIRLVPGVVSFAVRVAVAR